MPAPKKDAKQLVAALNSLEIGKVYTLDEIKELLNCGENIAKHLCKTFLEEVGKKTFRRTFEKPKHFKGVEQAMEDLRNRLAKNRRMKRLEEILTEDACVEQLKKLGYRLWKPTYEEV